MAGRLRLLLPGWDNPTHLNFLSLNLKLGSFVTVQPNAPSGLKYDAWEYPQGWHQTWAQLIRLWYRHPPTDARSLVDIYTVALVRHRRHRGDDRLRRGRARLCRDHTFAALVSMSIVAQLFAVGVLSMTVWFGFPNFALPVIAVAVVPSILLAADAATTGDLLRRERARARRARTTGGRWRCSRRRPLLVATLRLWKYAGETRPPSVRGGRDRVHRARDRSHRS